MQKILSIVGVAAMASLGLALPLAAPAHHQPDHGGGGGPLSVSATPETVTFGRTTTLAGRLGGNANGGVAIQLQAKPHPYTAEYATVATGTTASDGSYSFAGVRPLEHTRYRVVAATNRPETSGEVTVIVRIRVGLSVSDRTPRRGQLIRFYGSATPEHDGELVYIQKRITSTTWRTVARTRLRDAGDTRSRYSRRVRIYRDGVFRVIASGDANHGRGTSGARRLDVR